MRALVSGLAVVVTLLVVNPNREASACGACFGPPGDFTAVSSHRMVMALGIEETVLWDQFIYSGQPQDFAWVLPVPSTDVAVEVASQGFVDAMDRQTVPRVAPAYLECGSDGGGCCGFDCAPAIDNTGSVIVDGVDVVDRSVVGPYDTSTITADDPNAMYTWLQVNGYAFPDNAIATLDHYIENGSAFIALRLAPGEQVSAMEPVRVRFQGFMGTFPLEMVTIGATGPIELSLWVVAEQRYAAANYPTVTVDQNDLIWDWATQSSNYEDVFDATIEANGGRAWVAEYARRLDGELAQALKDAAYDDFEILATSLPAPYITRLRTRMLVDHIDQDIQLAPAEDSTDLPRTLLAYQSVNARCDGELAGITSIAPPRGDAAALLLLAIAVAIGFRRRNRGGLLTGEPSGS